MPMGLWESPGFFRLGDTLKSEPGEGFQGVDDAADSWHAIPIMSHLLCGLCR